MKTIVVYAIAFVALANGIHGQSSSHGTEQICTPGARSKIDCNTCICSNDGTALGCTRMECLKIPSEYLNPDGSLKLPHQSNPLLRARRVPQATMLPRQKRDQRCTPNSSFMVECNHCHCSSDGRSAACTLMACKSQLVNFYNPNDSLKRPQESNPLLRTKRDEESDSCVPYQSFQRDCNTCFCSADGRVAACTYRFCIPQSPEPSIGAPKIAT